MSLKSQIEGKKIKKIAKKSKKSLKNEKKKWKNKKKMITKYFNNKYIFILIIGA